MHLFRTSIPCFVGAALAAADPLPAAADAAAHAPNEPFRLQHVIVTAAPYARERFELAQPTSVVAGRELLLGDGGSLGELLNGQSGVSSTWFGPGASRPTIRGLAGDRVRILANGTGTLDASVISPDHAVSLDPLLIERVEVVRGPATLLHGGSALGGVVNVIDHRIHTARPEAPFNARIEARALSVNDEQSGGAVLEGGRGAFAWHVDGYRRTSGNVEIPGFAESAARRAAEREEAAGHGEEPPEEIAGYIPNTAVASDGGAIGFSLIGDGGSVGFAYSGHNTLYGVPAGAHVHAHDDDNDEPDEQDAEPEHEPGAVKIDLRQRRFDLQGTLTRPFAVFSGARFKLGTARYRHMELEGDEIGTVFRNRGFDARAELLHESAGLFRGAIGWQGGRSEFDAFGEEAFLPPSRTETHAVFVFEEAELAPFTWQIGARVERQDIELQNGSGLATDETALSASTGLVWSPGEAWTLSASLAHSERAPNAQELFADGAHIGTGAYEIGDPTLSKERSLALDLSLRRRVGFVTGALTVFAYDIGGYIYEQPTGEVAVEHAGEFELVPADDEAADGKLAVYRFVQHDARFHGAELELVLHLHESDAQRLDIIVGADTVRARNRSLNINLPRITPRRLKAGIAWERGPLALGGDIQWVAQQDRVAPEESPTDGYALIGAYATWRIAHGTAVVDLFVRGSNLGDEEARPHTSFLKDVAPLPGRNVAIGVRTTF